MSTLTINTTYDTAAVLTEAQLDEIKTPVETYFNTTGIEGSNIQANSLNGSTYLADDSVTVSKIIDNAVTTAKLQDSDSATTGITAAKINTNAITTAKLAASSVTTAKINDLAVTTAKINNSSTPKTIMLALPTASSTLADLTISEAAGVVASEGTATLVGSLTMTGLTAGKPIIINLQSTSTTGGYGYIGQTSYVSDATYGYTNQKNVIYVILKRDGTTVATNEINLGRVTGTTIYCRFPLSIINYIDENPTSSSHTYSLYLQRGTFVLTTTVTTLETTINSAKLVGIQIL